MINRLAPPIPATQPVAKDAAVDNAVISWHMVDGTPTALSRFKDAAWLGAPVGALEFELPRSRQIDFRLYPPEHQDRARLALYCSLRHPTRINKPPNFGTLLKRAQALRRYFEYLTLNGGSLERTTVRDTQTFLEGLARRVDHIETLVGQIACLREINVFASRGYLDFQVPMLATSKGASAIARRIWRDVHGKDFASDGYIPFQDDEITLVVRNALFYVSILGPALVDVAKQCYDIADGFPNRRVDRSEEGLCFRAQRKVCEKYEWPASDADIPNWPPRNLKTVMTHVRMCSAACAIVFCFATGARRSEVLSLDDNALEVLKGSDEFVVHLVYRKGEDDLNGREIALPVPREVAAALKMQSAIKAVIIRNVDNVVNPPQRTKRLFVTIGGQYLEDNPVDVESTNATSKAAGAAFVTHLDLSEPSSSEEDLPSFSWIGGPLGAQGLNGMLRDFKAYLGLDIEGRIGVHRLRKTVGRLVTLSMEGAPLILQHIFGQENANTTLGYMFRSPFIHDELVENYPELVTSNLRTLYAGRHDLFGGGASLLQETTGLRSQAFAALTEPEVGMSEDQFVELGLQMVKAGHMVLSFLGPGTYCLKPLTAYGPCNSSKKELFPNVGRCTPSCQHHIQLGSQRSTIVASIQWFNKRLVSTEVSEPLRRFYTAYRDDLQLALGAK